jgi:cytidine deaminase
MGRNTGPSDRDGAGLVQAARRARRLARARYSGFRVGAALETSDGRVVAGCNVENASYGLTMCAERVALFAAIAAGHRRFRRMAIVATGGWPVTPCGACRQVLWEFAPSLRLLLAAGRAAPVDIALSDLLPRPFDARRLGRR